MRRSIRAIDAFDAQLFGPQHGALGSEVEGQAAGGVVVKAGSLLWRMKEGKEKALLPERGDVAGALTAELRCDCCPDAEERLVAAGCSAVHQGGYGGWVWVAVSCARWAMPVK